MTNGCPTKRDARHVTYGYDGPGDSPSYARPTAGGAVTTYVVGPRGMVAIDAAGTATYPVVNGHGDIVGNTDAAGAFTAAPVADEFGRGPTPAGRLGWLGSHQRYSTGASLGLVRMGVRLYDPAIGRFLQVDPVEGGNENDYVYPADPINHFDLDGRCGLGNPFKKCGKGHKGGTNLFSGAFSKAKTHSKGIAQAALVVGGTAFVVGSLGTGAIALGAAYGVGELVTYGGALVATSQVIGIGALAIQAAACFCRSTAVSAAFYAGGFATRLPAAAQIAWSGAGTVWDWVSFARSR